MLKKTKCATKKGKWAKEYSYNDYTEYKVTPKTIHGKPFPTMKFRGGTVGGMHAMGINMHQGNVYGKSKETGKWELLKKVV